MSDGQGSAGSAGASGPPAAPAGSSGPQTPGAGSGSAASQAGNGPAPTPEQQREAIVADQHGPIIAAFADGMAEIACNDRQFMETRGATVPKDWACSGKVVALPNRNPDDAFVFVASDGKPQLWVRPDYSDYGGLFDLFSQQYYGVAWSKVASSDDWNIDHMYPHTAAELSQVKYVRLTPIDAKANQAMGRNIEKQMARRGREINNALEDGEVPRAGRRAVLKATYFTLGKLTGFHDAVKLPQDRGDFVDQAVIDRLVAHVSTHCKFVEPAQMSRLNAVLTRRSATVIQTPLNERQEKLVRFDAAHRSTLRGGG